VPEGREPALCLEEASDVDGPAAALRGGLTRLDDAPRSDQPLRLAALSSKLARAFTVLLRTLSRRLLHPLQLVSHR
jgi:hypothetical protein